MHRIGFDLIPINRARNNNINTDRYILSIIIIMPYFSLHIDVLMLIYLVMVW